MKQRGAPHPIYLLLTQHASTSITIITDQNEYTVINRLTPNDPYMVRTAPLTSKRCILYIYSTNIGTEYFNPLTTNVNYSRRTAPLT